jgi:hypothetical protein
MWKIDMMYKKSERTEPDIHLLNEEWVSRYIYHFLPIASAKEKKQIKLPPKKAEA